MVVDDFHVVRVILAPYKTYAPLIVDADAVPSGPVVPQDFQTIPGRGTQVLKRLGGVQHLKLSRRIRCMDCGSPAENLP